MAHAVEVGAEIRRALEAARTRIPSVGEVRGLVLMLGLGVLDPNSGIPASSGVETLLEVLQEAKFAARA